MAIPSRIRDRLVSGLKSFAPILRQQQDRDITEADTVTLVKDVMSQMFGFDKYAELTSEYAIRGTFCDLAVKVDGKLTHLIEVKGIGIPLEDRHVKQAIDYASNEGVEWVILTNAAHWRLYKVIFAKPIDKRMVVDLDFLQLNPKSEETIDCLYAFTREGYCKGAHVKLHDHQQASSRYVFAAILLHNEEVRDVIQREMRRAVDVKISDDVITRVLRDEVIKRDTLEGPEADEARRRVTRSEGKAMRKTRTPAECDAEMPALVAAPPIASEVRGD